MPPKEPADNQSPAGETGENPIPPPETHGSTLEDILDRYLDELARGNNPDQEAYIAAHPDLANALRGVFKTLDFVEAASKSPNASALERGQHLGEYRIIREVGRGGMGVVYEAVQTSLDRRVALKVLPSVAMLSDTAPDRFAREAATAGRLHHSNIVPVYAVGVEQGIHYYAMQFIDGHSLSEHIRNLRQRHKQLGHDYSFRVAHWGRQTAEALEHAHREGTVHRDIKPSNLLLDSHDDVWITDFGLARANANVSITRTGDVVGTARYMSPEQARGDRTSLNARTDIYSLGVTLYELLALTPAFDGPSHEAVLNQIASAEPRPLRQVRRSIPRDLETIVAKCMDKDPTRRYGSAADVAEDCRRFIAGEPIRARRTSLLTKGVRLVRRHRFYAIGAVLLISLGLTSLVLSARIRHVQGQRQLDEAYTALLYEQDSAGAAVLLDQAENLSGNDIRLHLGRGLIPLLTGQPQRSFEHLERALTCDANDSETCLAMAYAYRSIADPVSGQRYLDRVPADRIKTPLGWYLRGSLQPEENLDEALECYARALSIRADFMPAIQARASQRGHRLLIDGDREMLEPMLADFDAWVTIRADSPRAYTWRASGWQFAAAYAASQPDLRDRSAEWLSNSAADFARAYELGGESVNLRCRHGAYLRYIGDYAGSAEAFATAIATDRERTGNDHPGIVHQHAISLHAMGDIEAALEEVTAATEALPSFFPLPLHRAILLAEAGRHNEALQLCRDTLESQKNNGAGLFLAAGVLEFLGDSATATATLNACAAAENEDNASDPNAPTLSRPMSDYIAGRLDSAALLASVRDHPGRLCECALFVALREIGRGNREAGVDALQTSLDSGVFIYAHYRFAQALMARAQASPDWPHWCDASQPTLGS